MQQLTRHSIRMCCFPLPQIDLAIGVTITHLRDRRLVCWPVLGARFTRTKTTAKSHQRLRAQSVRANWGNPVKREL